MKKFLAYILIIVLAYFAPLLAALDWLIDKVRHPRDFNPYIPRVAKYWKSSSERLFTVWLYRDPSRGVPPQKPS